MAAIMSLGLHSVGEDRVKGYDIDYLYTVAESAIVGWPVEVRPIP